MEQVAFIVWRESVEALLVIGILYSWLKSTKDGHAGIPWLWAGVGAGFGLAIMLALLLLGIATWLDPLAQEWFQAIMALAACALIVQMVVWMRRHARSLKSDLQKSVDSNIESNNWWGVFALTAIAVAREGSETVVFLYGVVLSSDHSILYLIVAGLAGFVAALFTFGVLQLGLKFFSWRHFFKVTEILLLLLAGALLMTSVDKLIMLGALPTILDPVWDSSWIISSMSGVGKVLADFAGYRDYPALSQLLIFLAYWGLVFILLARGQKTPAKSIS